MARILCNVAGGGKPLKGNAETGDVLAGKTFSNKQSNALTGSMPNNGTNKKAVSVGGGSGSLWAYMPYGYYDNYNNSGNAWIDITNDQAKTLANNAGVGYNSGYTNGHNQGVNDGINSVNIDFFCLWAFESNASNWQGHGYSLRNSLNKNGGKIVSVGDFGWYNSGGGNTRHGELIAKVNCTVVSNKGTWNLNAGQHFAVSICDGQNSSGQWEGYAYAR